MYRLSYLKLLDNGEYRNIVTCPMTYSTYDIRTKVILTLDNLLNRIYEKYNTELNLLDSNYIIYL